MEYTEFKEKFAQAIEKNGLSPLCEEMMRKFYTFTLHLLKVNQVTNLTAIRDVEGVIAKHYVDSLLISRHISSGARVLDLGCGPGFPSLPLAISRPDLTFVGLDSTAKKIAFANESAELLALKNMRAVVGRAEDRNVMKRLGTFDVVTSRAVANPIVLCELSLAYLKIGGKMLAMKGAAIEEETASLNKSRILGIMGGGTAACTSWSLFTETSEEARGMIEVTKERYNDPQYPRVYATIIKKPL